MTGVLKPLDWPNFSATIVANGYTVDDPTIEIWSLACAAVERARPPIMPAIKGVKRILFKLILNNKYTAQEDHLKNWQSNF